MMGLGLCLQNLHWSILLITVCVAFIYNECSTFPLWQSTRIIEKLVVITGHV